MFLPQFDSYIRTGYEYKVQDANKVMGYSYKMHTRVLMWLCFSQPHTCTMYYMCDMYTCTLFRTRHAPRQRATRHTLTVTHGRKRTTHTTLAEAPVRTHSFLLPPCRGCVRAPLPPPPLPTFTTCTLT